MNNRNNTKRAENKAIPISSEPDLQIPTIPEDLICPLSMQIFLDPVKVPIQKVTNRDGTNANKYVTTERQVIERWLRDKGKNPFTRHPLKISELISDDEMKVRVSGFLDSYKSSRFYESLQEKQYKPEATIERAYESVRQPTNPDADDLLAMQRAASEEVGLAGLRSGNNLIPYQTFAHTFMDFHVQRNRIASRGQRLIQETVMTLQAYGLTADLIRENWRPAAPTAAWGGFERDALLYFVTGQPPQLLISIEEIIDQLPAALHLTPLQALQEITTLNFYQLSCLVCQYQKGLRGDHLRTWNDSFDSEQYLAMHALVVNEEINPPDALERIRGLSDADCLNIYRRRTRRPDGEQNHDATIASAQRLQVPAPRFFRRQPNQVNTQMYIEIYAVTLRAFRELGYANPSRYYANTTPEPYVGITVADIPNFPETNEQTPFYWQTQLRQTESEQEQQASFLPKP